jgi:hypothetical protein
VTALAEGLDTLPTELAEDSTDDSQLPDLLRINKGTESPKGAQLHACPS